MKTGIVILNWNGKDMLRRYLPVLVKCSRQDDAQIIVADNCSTDGSVEMMQSEFPDIRLIRLDRNYGFAKGYNMALKQVECEYYILLNSDVKVTPDWLLPLVSYMDVHPGIAACQPKLLDLKDPEYFEYAGGAGGYMDKWGYMYCRGRVFDTIEKDEGQYDSIQDVFWATGACLMIRSADYWAAGGLDDRFFAHQEEIDLCWRLRSRNRRIVCIPESVVYHVGGATLNKSNPYKTFLNFRNNLLMLYKNLPENELAKVMRVRFWLDGLAALVFILKFHLGDAKAVFRARREFRRLKPEFLDSRKENIEESSLADIPERADFSLLWRYHVKRCRTWSDL
ncbi:MAG: glycosyltransferase family 2 protein [Bacteroidaceae bacterium]|nr:glycosyltransferase family 2 protein [Bacteroidaceae bacterium]